MRLLRESTERLCHAVKEEGVRCVFAAVPIRRGDQFFGLRHGKRCKQLRKHGL